MNPWLGIGAVLGVLLALMGLLKFCQSRFSIPAELSRKAVHVGMGLTCLTFPWVFSEPWPVFVLAALAVGGMALLRFVPQVRSRFGSVLGGVERQSWGEFYFPIAVALVFLLSGRNILLYGIPILTLTLADTVGALIGVRYGFARYHTDEGLKSAEGSVAFFTAAFLSCHIPLLLLSDTGRAETLLISLTAGFLIMLMEAIAWRGQDNLIIPLGMFFLLALFLPMDAGQLALRFLVILALVAFVLIWRSRTTLSDSAVLAGALSGYAVWAFGGWYALLAPLVLFTVYVGLPSFPKESRPMQNLHAVTRVMAGVFLWLFLVEVTNDDRFFVPYLLCLAAHTGNIVTARLRVVRGELGMARILMIAWLLPTLLFGLLGGLGIWMHALPVPVLFLIPLSVLLSIVLFVPSWPTVHVPEEKARIWLSETCIAILASLPGLIVFFKS